MSALPFIVLLLTLIFIRGTHVGDVAQRVQQIMMLAMAITGGYLLLLPYMVKWQRLRKGGPTDSH